MGRAIFGKFVINLKCDIFILFEIFLNFQNKNFFVNMAMINKCEMINNSLLGFAF